MAVPSNIEWSLPVPSVQELTSRPIESVPPRYVRADVADPAINPCNPSIQIPLIDLSKLAAGISQETELKKLSVACKEWGAFQLINHGISDELIRKTKEQVKGFFDLPLQEKQVCAQRPGDLEGYGNAFVVSEEQKLEWCDMISIKALPARNRNLDFWPKNPHEFRETLDNYSEEVRKVTISLLGFMAMALELQAQQFSKDFEDGKYWVRMNYYPPCPQPELVNGVSPHTDITGITLLLEGNNTPGLQCLKDGVWVPIMPLVDAIVVNVGDMIEIMSNGIYKSLEHRAVTNKETERLSIVTFCFPDDNSEVGPVPDLVNPENPAIFETVSNQDYFRRFHDQRVVGARFVDSLKINPLPLLG